VINDGARAFRDGRLVGGDAMAVDAEVHARMLTVMPDRRWIRRLSAAHSFHLSG
jgi:hypothetical protein